MTQKRDRSEREGRGYWDELDAIKKWPGVKASTLLSSPCGSATSGLLFMQASTWGSTVESSSKFSFTGQSLVSLGQVCSIGESSCCKQQLHKVHQSGVYFQGWTVIALAEKCKFWDGFLGLLLIHELFDLLSGTDKIGSMITHDQTGSGASNKDLHWQIWYCLNVSCFYQ